MTYLTAHSMTPTPFEETYPLPTMTSALHSTIATILTLQQIHHGSHKTPNSLNLCVTDGLSLLAYRFRNHRTSQPPSLYFSTKAGTTLNRKYPDNPDGAKTVGREIGIPEERHGKHLIVASEPSTYREEDWELIGKNQILIAGPDGVFEIENVPYGQGWDAEG